MNEVDDNDNDDNVGKNTSLKPSSKDEYNPKLPTHHYDDDNTSSNNNNCSNNGKNLNNNNNNVIVENHENEDQLANLISNQSTGGTGTVGNEEKEIKATETICHPMSPITVESSVDYGHNDDGVDGSATIVGVVKNNLNRDNEIENDNREMDTNDDDGYVDYDYYDDEPEPDDELLVQFLGEACLIAEARLAARRQARAEAREIRIRELERQQKEQEQNADRVFDMHNATTASTGIDPLSRTRLTSTVGGISGLPVSGIINTTRASSMSSRRSSEDSLEEEGRSLRDIRHELKDVEDRFRKAMIANALLDNERASQTYHIKLLNDKLEEMEEAYAQLQREFKEKSRDCNALKRNLERLSEELKLVQGQLNERDTLIAEQGLVIVAVENDDGTDAKRALVTVENAHVLGSKQGSLDVRLKKFNEEKQQLLVEIQQLQALLETYKNEGGRGKGRANSMNGPLGSDEDYEAQREANKIISEYKYKLQKAEQEIASLQASLARSETQVIRYKSTAEAAEIAEADLKTERRKLQRENREAMERLEELETSNNHLLKRLDKLKNAKSALLKDL